jgi:hypothetical protein
LLDVKNSAVRIDPPHDPDTVNDYAPAERWDHDVLEASKLLAVIDEITIGCAELSREGAVRSLLVPKEPQA